MMKNSFEELIGGFASLHVFSSKLFTETTMPRFECIFFLHYLLLLIYILYTSLFDPLTLALSILIKKYIYIKSVFFLFKKNTLIFDPLSIA